jgi:release factor glutamine methyltransferase
LSHAAPALRDDATRQGHLRRLTALFHEAGIPEAAFDARLLLCDAAGLSQAQLAADPDVTLDAAAVRRLESHARRRIAREPVTRILGRRGFWTLDLDVIPGVLDPRPDSETLVEAALAAIGPGNSRALRILDLGSGSGALIGALLDTLPAATGVAVDLSPHACAATHANLMKLGLMRRAEVRHGDWAAALPGPYDLVVSNPPYIASADIDGLDPEVRDHDPRLALDGGADGLDAYRAIACLLPELLAPGGIVVLEIGLGQAASVAALLEGAGMTVEAPRRDLGGLERVLIGRR